jgi:hypothetical protein
MKVEIVMKVEIMTDLLECLVRVLLVEQDL